MNQGPSRSRWGYFHQLGPDRNHTVHLAVVAFLGTAWAQTIFQLGLEAQNKTVGSPLGSQEPVERPTRGHFHHQHQGLSLTDANHADNVGIVQLVHDLGLLHHVVPCSSLIATFQHLDGHVDLLPGTRPVKTRLDAHELAKRHLSKGSFLFSLNLAEGP